MNSKEQIKLLRDAIAELVAARGGSGKRINKAWMQAARAYDLTQPEIRVKPPRMGFRLMPVKIDETACETIALRNGGAVFFPDGSAVTSCGKIPAGESLTQTGVLRHIPDFAKYWGVRPV